MAALGQETLPCLKSEQFLLVRVVRLVASESGINLFTAIDHFDNSHMDL